MSLSEGLIAVVAYGVLILVVETMKNHTVTSHVSATQARGLGRVMLSPIFDYPHVLLPLAAIWMLSLRVANALMFSDLLQVRTTGLSGLLVTLMTLLLLAMPIILPSRYMLETLYSVNGATTRAFRGHVMPWLFLVFWLGALSPGSVMPLIGLWTVLFSVDFATACTKSRQRPILVLICVLALLVCWSYIGGRWFFG